MGFSRRRVRYRRYGKRSSIWNEGKFNRLATSRNVPLVGLHSPILILCFLVRSSRNVEAHSGFVYVRSHPETITEYVEESQPYAMMKQ